MVRNEIRLMEAAVALAEELHFSHAARRLRITQPALTKQIAELEHRFTLSLFERDSQSVSLTDAGKAFVEQARLAILHSQRAVQAARSITASAELILRVGKSPYVDPFLISMLLAIQLPSCPKLKVQLTSGFSGDLVRDVLSEVIDLALVIEPPPYPTLSMLEVAKDCFYVALSEDHPLAQKHELTLEELNHERWVLFGRSVNPFVYDSLSDVIRDRSLNPSEMHDVLVPEEACPYLTERTGFALFTKSTALRIARDGITLRPLIDQHLALRTYLAARADNSSRFVSELVRAYGRRLRNIDAGIQLNLRW